MSNVNTVCSFHIPSIPANAAVMIGDPCEVPLQVSEYPDFQADQLNPSTLDSGRLTVVLDALSFNAGTEYHSTGSSYGDGTRRVQFYQLSVLNGDLSVSQSILAFGSSGGTAAVSHGLITRQRGVPGPIMRDSIDKFILSHGAPDTQMPNHAELYKKAQKQGSHMKPIQDDPWTLSMEWLQSEIDRLCEKKTILFQEALNSLHSDIEQDSDKEFLLPRTM